MNQQLARHLMRDELRTVCDFLKVTEEKIFSKDQSAPIVRARRAIARELSHRGLTSTKIGKILGRDHSTVLTLIGAYKQKRSKKSCR